jgi:UDP-3-O-[3-hydroxymyristoyl] glucosamine N-acyltransferase
LNRSPASAAIVSSNIIPEGKSYITVADARAAFARVMCEFCPRRTRRRVGISPAAHVSDSARLGVNADIYPNATIEDDVIIGANCVIHSGVVIMAGCQLGNDVTIYPGAILYSDTRIGHRVTIHANAVIGADGFGFELAAGAHQLAPQLGNVEIGNDVVIGANSTIDRGTYSATRIGDGTKLDNLVMIGHNCQIGRHNLLCAQVGIAGSVKTGDYVVMGGQVGIRDHVELADGVQLGAQSGVGESILEAGRYLGAPAIPLRKEIQILLTRQKLPEMRRQIAELEKSNVDINEHHNDAA